MLFGTETAELGILDWIHTIAESDFMDFLMVRITKLGNAGLIWICVALVLISIPKYRKNGWHLALGLVIGLALGIWGAKNIIARPRPFMFNEAVGLLIPTPLDFSFPSGHTMASFISVFMLFKTEKWMGWTALPIAILIAFSRMYLYVHFPTDIIGGIVFAYLSYALTQKLNRMKKHEH